MADKSEMTGGMNAGFEEVMKMLINLMETLIKMDTFRVNKSTSRFVQQQALEKIPFDLRMHELYDAVEHMRDVNGENSLAGLAEEAKQRGMMDVSKILSDASKPDCTYSERQELMKEAHELTTDDSLQYKIESNMKRVGLNQKAIMEKIEEIGEKGLSAERGLREFLKVVGSFDISEKDRDDLRKIAENCRQGLHSISVSVVPAEAENILNRALRDTHIDRDPNFKTFRGPDNMIYVMTGSYFNESMRHIVQSINWSLGRSMEPTEEELKADTYDREPQETKTRAATISLELKDAALAEKVKNEIRRNGVFQVSVSHQFKEGDDLPYESRVIIAAGGDKMDKDKAYSELMTGLAMGSMQLAGPGGKQERQRMNHLIRQRHEMMDILDDIKNERPVSGTYYIAHKQDDMFLPDTYVKFNEESFVPVSNGVTGLTQTKDGDPDGYAYRLKSFLWSSNVEKIFITDERQETLNANAREWASELGNMLEEKNELDVKNDISMKISEIKAEMRQTPRQQQGDLRNLLLKYESMDAAMKIADRLNKREGAAKVAPDSYRTMQSAVMSKEIESKVFQDYVREPEQRRQIDIFHDMIHKETMTMRVSQAELQKRGRTGPLYAPNRMRMNAGTNTMSYKLHDMSKFMNSYDPERYIANLYERNREAEKDDTIKPVLEEDIEDRQKILQEIMDGGLLEEAASLFEGAEIHMDRIDPGLEQIVTKESEKAEENARKHMEVARAEVENRTPDFMQEQEKGKEQEIEIDTPVR